MNFSLISYSYINRDGKEVIKVRGGDDLGELIRLARKDSDEAGSRTLTITDLLEKDYGDKCSEC